MFDCAKLSFIINFTRRKKRTFIPKCNFLYTEQVFKTDQTINMKTLLSILLTFLVAGAVNAQKSDSRLLSAYSSDELATIQQEKPEFINVLNYALDNACYFTETGSKDNTNLAVIEISNLKKTPCFAELGLKITDQNQYFRIKGSDKVLVVKSEIVLSYELKKQSK